MGKLELENEEMVLNLTLENEWLFSANERLLGIVRKQQEEITKLMQERYANKKEVRISAYIGSAIGGMIVYMLCRIAIWLGWL